MPFLVFHQAVEIYLNRRVAAGQYLRPRRLLEALTGNLPAPSIEDVLRLAPRTDSRFSWLENQSATQT